MTPEQVQVHDLTHLFAGLCCILFLAQVATIYLLIEARDRIERKLDAITRTEDE